MPLLPDCSQTLQRQFWKDHTLHLRFNRMWIPKHLSNKRLHYTHCKYLHMDFGKEKHEMRANEKLVFSMEV